MFARVFRVHLVGIGGIGMSGIAEVLLVMGWPVSGSDLRASPVTERLASLGARIHIGHAAENIGEAEVVVTSSAVGTENAEVRAAHERGIPVIPRAEMLAELMRLKYGIAVGGMHGKTTTTSMIATVLAAAGLDPTVVVGGRLDSIGSNARLGGSQFLVAEADESDRSFLKLAPILAVITNIDREHLDCYRDLADIAAAFVEFANRVPFYGTVLVGIDEEATRMLLPQIQRRKLTYGEAADSDVRIVDVDLSGSGSRFRLEHSHAAAPLFGREAAGMLGEFQLAVPGRHNIANATAAIAIGLLLGRDLAIVRSAMAGFRGVDRRFQLCGTIGGVRVIDDYGHHPRELAATIAAARQYNQANGGGRVLMIFQPHRYTRTYHLRAEFAEVLSRVDRAWLLDIYPAGEAPIAGVTAPALAAAARACGGAVRHAESAEAAIAAAVAECRPGDLILTQGAGSVSRLGAPLLAALAARFSEALVSQASMP